MNSISDINDRIKLLTDQAALMKRIIEDAPEGQLTARKCKSGSYKYMVRTKTSNGKKTEKYIPKKEKITAVKLANKLYAKKRLNDINAELSFLKAELKYKSYKSQSDEFQKAHPGMVLLLYKDYPQPESEAIAWGNQSYNRNEKYPENLKYPTRQ